MKANYGLYPSFERYFGSKRELADAACMSRTHLCRCLYGKAQFRKAEKIAIMNYLTVRNKYGVPSDDLFDLIFKDEVTT